mmetsp:Transcript_10453/g.12869  ORF Transcript_10453/g.12869 Transcript_10453/m.12869 type:complete len:87 (-) Transcript_10453:214-474(-)
MMQTNTTTREEQMPRKRSDDLDACGAYSHVSKLDEFMFVTPSSQKQCHLEDVRESQRIPKLSSSTVMSSPTSEIMRPMEFPRPFTL